MASESISATEFCVPNESVFAAEFRYCILSHQ